MGYNLYQTNRIESFLSREGDRLIQADPFDTPVPCIVQNRNMGEWIKLSLAERKGAILGWDILYPEQAIRYFADQFDHPWKDGEKTVLFMDNLKVILYKKLEEIQKTNSVKFSLLTDFLRDELSLYEAADVLTGLFYGYGMNCFDLVSAWEGGTSLSEEREGRENIHEIWQRELWDELFGPGAPYILLSRILTHIRERNLPFLGNEKRIILFGSSFLGDTGLNFFTYLSGFLEVDHFLLTPSRAFIPERKEKILAAWEGLTGLMGGVSRFFAQDSSAPTTQIYWEELDYQPTLLGRLQRSLWLNHEDEPEGEDLFSSGNLKDDSLLFVSAPGQWRQVEAAKNRIIGLLREDSAIGLNEIALMAPDINDYASYIEAVFSHGDYTIPCHFIDLKSSGQSAYLEGFDLLLELAGSRFEREEIRRLWDNPCFANALGIGADEREQWDEFIREGEVRWGMDGDHLKDLDFPRLNNNRWERAFERFLDGMVFHDEGDDESLPIILPEESRNVSLGNMIHLLRSLYQDFYKLSRQSMPMEGWIPRLERLMEVYLKPRPDHGGDGKDRERIKGVFRNLNNLMEGLDWLGEWENRHFPWSVFKTILKELVSKNSLGKGGYLTRGISCASLKPLRAVPFKVIILLGMDYGVFPSRDNSFSFDLTELAGPAVDLSRNSADRYSFLEVLTSARDKLWIYYTGEDPVNGEERLPSVVVSELKDLLCDKKWMGAEEDPRVIREALHPFDPSYFNGKRERSWDRDAFGLARAFMGEKREPTLSLHTVEREPPEEIDMADLIYFFNNPPKTFGRKTLKLFLDEEEDKQGDEEEIEPDFWESSRLYQDILLSWFTRGNLSPDSLPPLLNDWWTEQMKRGRVSGYRWDLPVRENLLKGCRDFLNSLNSLDRQLFQGVIPRNIIFSGPRYDSGETVYLEKPQLVLDKDMVHLAGETGWLYGEERPTKLSYYYGQGVTMKNRLPSLITHLMLSLGKKEHKGLLTLYAGPRGAARLEGWAAQGMDLGDTFKMTGNDAGVMEKLISLYRDNLRSPLPFYPSLAEKAAHEIDKGRWEFDELPRRWPDLWEEALRARNGFHDIRHCPYREIFFPRTPSWNDRLEDLFSNIIPLLMEAG